MWIASVIRPAIDKGFRRLVPFPLFPFPAAWFCKQKQVPLTYYFKYYWGRETHSLLSFNTCKMEKLTQFQERRLPINQNDLTILKVYIAFHVKNNV